MYWSDKKFTKIGFEINLAKNTLRSSNDEKSIRISGGYDNFWVNFDGSIGVVFKKLFSGGGLTWKL